MKPERTKKKSTPRKTSIDDGFNKVRRPFNG